LDIYEALNDYMFIQRFLEFSGHYLQLT